MCKLSVWVWFLELLMCHFITSSDIVTLSTVTSTLSHSADSRATIGMIGIHTVNTEAAINPPLRP